MSSTDTMVTACINLRNKRSGNNLRKQIDRHYGTGCIGLYLWYDM